MKIKLLLLLNAGFIACAQAQVVPPDAIVAGRTIPEWTAEWWKWLLSFPAAENPDLDYTGEKLLQGQPPNRPFIFLSQQIEEHPPFKRSVTIEEGSYLLVPIIPFFNNAFGEDPWGPIAEEQRDGAMEYSASTSLLDGSLDGTALTNLIYTSGQRVTNLFRHRTLAPEFTVWMPATNNLYQYFNLDVAGIFDPCYGDGFWLALAPLSLGEHEIKVKAFATNSYPADITFYLRVQELDLPRALSALLPTLAAANLPNKASKKLRARLVAAEKLFNDQNLRIGLDELERFQSEVQVCVRPNNEPLASELYYATERIIIAAKRRLGIAPPESPFETEAPIQESPISFEQPPSSSATPSVFPREDFWLPDGPVHAVLATNGLVYLAGAFNYLSRPNAPTAGAFDSFSASPDRDFPAINGAVHGIIADGQGGWFIGGEFSLVAGLPRANLVRLRSDRTVDPDWRADTDGAVLALALSDNILYIGGSFSTIAGAARDYLAAIEAATTEVRPWNPAVSASAIKPNPRGVRALAVADGLLYVAGAFSKIGEVKRENLAAIDLETGQATDWQPIIFNLPENTQVIDALLISGDTAYVGSRFMRSINSVPRNFTAAFDLRRTTSNLLPWNPDVNGPVLAMASSCDAVFLGGSFTTVGGQPRASLAAVDPLFGTATSWNPGADGTVHALALSGNLLYAGGQFTRIGGQPRSALVRIDISFGVVDGWDARPLFTVSTILLSGNNVLAGGGAAGMIRKNLAALDALTGKPTAWDPSPDGAVYAVALAGKRLYIGGDFLNVAGQARNRLAAVDSENGAALEWSPSVDGFERANAIVESVLVSSNAVYVAGSFTNLNGQPRLHLAALKPRTGELLPWNPGANEDVRVLRISGNTIFAAGRFTEIGGHLRRRLAALDAVTGAVLSWNPEADDAVRALEITGESVFAGGLLSTVENFRRGRLAKIDASSGLLDSWQPQAANTNFIGPYEQTSYVNALTPLSEIAFVGGLFNNVGGQSHNNLAALDASGRVLDWSADADLPVIVTTYVEGALYVGGVFRTIAGEFHPNFAVFPPLGAPRIVRQPPSRRVNIGEVISLEAEASGMEPLSYQWQFNGANLPGATSPTLSIRSAAIADSGEYILIVTNKIGMVSSRPGLVTVIEPLRIVTQPVSQTVAPGSLVTLAVKVAGHPSPTFQWRLNGVNIPGAISSTFTIPNAQPTNGGSYQILIANIGGAIGSEVATVLVTAPALPFADNLGLRTAINGSSGVLSGSNLGATKETGEPNHAGKVGGKSVWVRWRAPANGIATLRTRGSDFDTLLGIYTGTDISDLVPVVSDDDRGGFGSSQASFNAVADTEYLVAIDGYAGASGNIALSWNLDPTTVLFPRILNQPLSQTITAGRTASFFIDINSPTPATYQWFFGCREIPGATNSSLIINNAQQKDVGNYRVLVVNASSHVAESLEAFLEIGADPKGLSRDKWEDLLFDSGLSPLTANKDFGVVAASGSGFIPVFAGTINAQVFNNTGATTQQGETNHCGVIGGSSRWFGLQPLEKGTMLIDTIGSSFDTVLAVYTGTNSVLTLKVVACDNNSAPDGIRSLVVFPAGQGTNYSVAVDGVNGAQGTIVLNWRLGTTPTPTNSASVRTLRLGDSIRLENSVAALPPQSYQWLWNGRSLQNATNATLNLSSLQSAQAGTYSVIVSNFAGVVTNTVSTITVAVPIGLSYNILHTNARSLFHITGPASARFAIEATTNFVDWFGVYTNSNPTAPIDFLDSGIERQPHRFYRVNPTR